ncbi:MAG: NfeD family protein [Pirellulaceae bacterium]
MSGLVWAIRLLLAALVVIAIEMFVPSAGLLAILSTVLIISSIVVAFFYSVPAGVGLMIAVALLMPLIFLAFVHVWPNTPIGKRVLIGRVKHEDVVLTGEHYDEREQLIGKQGIARTKMLPSGMVVIDGNKYDAVSEGMAIEPGDPVKVVAIRAFKVIVRKMDPSETVTSSSLEDDDILSRPIDDVFDS